MLPLCCICTASSRSLLTGFFALKQSLWTLVIVSSPDRVVRSMHVAAFNNHATYIESIAHFIQISCVYWSRTNSGDVIHLTTLLSHKGEYNGSVHQPSNPPTNQHDQTVVIFFNLGTKCTPCNIFHIFFLVSIFLLIIRYKNLCVQNLYIAIMLYKWLRKTRVEVNFYNLSHPPILRL